MESKYFGIFLLIICGSLVSAHNYLTNPNSRGNQQSTQTGCRFGGEGSPSCSGPCDRKISQINNAPIVIQRGQTIQINWYRHTHPGGFIRFAWSPTSQSDSHESFDQHVQQFTCKEIGGCGPSDPSQPYYTTNGLDCGTTIQVPSYLTNGAWTLQWAYFGGWFNAGDYYACVDYTVSGGTSVGTQQPAVYIGGDYTFPNQNVCLFYSTNALHVCTAEPCLNGTYPIGDQKGPVLGYGGSAPITTKSPATVPSTTASPVPLTTGKAAPITTGLTLPVTTGKAPMMTTGLAQPMTTGLAQPMTTARPQPVTTGLAQPMTTAMPKPMTTSLAAPLTTSRQPAQPMTTSMMTAPTTGSVVPPVVNPNQPGNCAGLSVLSRSTATITEMDFWGTGYHAIITITVQEALLSNWFLEIIFPPNQSGGTVGGAYNGGTLKCQNSYSAIVRSNSWANAATQGTTLIVEITGNNLQSLTQEAIRDNTVLRMYTQ